ncbi:MAG: citrate synthase [Oscillospiraceae bacterium]|nr:citrate synthase [Oscillospiraceae bacterium]
MSNIDANYLEINEYIRRLFTGINSSTTAAMTKMMRDDVDVKRGLRNADGTGVMIGYTQIGNVLGYSMLDGERVPMEGRLSYRGFDLVDLIEGYQRENRYGFEEVCYLLLMGRLPGNEELEQFRSFLHASMALPNHFTEDMILKNPSGEIMNQLGRAVLALYSNDPDPANSSLENIVRQCFQLIARFPTIIANAYAVKRHYFNNASLYLHRPVKGLSIAENFLRAIRPDKQYTQDEARLLDLCLIAHAEHGGGNNSTFTCRVLSSTGTDTYSAISAAVGSLKGPKHGGANNQVMRQFQEIKDHVQNWNDEGQVADYLRRILRKEASDGTGLIYGMGHAIYTLSDPRAAMLKKYARALADKTERSDELDLMETIERLTPHLFAEVTGKEKVMCANVDLYSGLIYKMLNIPQELFTPVFAMARIPGWCAHRIEEVVTGGRIMRPAYKAVFQHQDYIPLKDRQ